MILKRRMTKVLLREFIKAVLTEDTSSDKMHDPAYWGLEDTDVSRKTLRVFLENYKDVADHVMLVDDMEDMGLREAIETGDVQLLDIVVNEILQAHPLEDYDPFANDNNGSDPRLPVGNDVN